MMVGQYCLLMMASLAGAGCLAASSHGQSLDSGTASAAVTGSASTGLGSGSGSGGTGIGVTTGASASSTGFGGTTSGSSTGSTGGLSNGSTSGGLYTGDAGPCAGTEFANCGSDSDCACDQRCVRDDFQMAFVCETACASGSDCPNAATTCTDSAEPVDPMDVGKTCTVDLCGSQDFAGSACATTATASGDGTCVPIPGLFSDSAPPVQLFLALHRFECRVSG
jgi:hypothetical protein